MKLYVEAKKNNQIKGKRTLQETRPYVTVKHKNEEIEDEKIPQQKKMKNDTGKLESPFANSSLLHV